MGFPDPPPQGKPQAWSCPWHQPADLPEEEGPRTDKDQRGLGGGKLPPRQRDMRDLTTKHRALEKGDPPTGLGIQCPASEPERPGEAVTRGQRAGAEGTPGSLWGFPSHLQPRGSAPGAEARPGPREGASGCGGGAEFRSLVTPSGTLSESLGSSCSASVSPSAELQNWLMGSSPQPQEGGPLGSPFYSEGN